MSSSADDRSADRQTTPATRRESREVERSPDIDVDATCADGQTAEPSKIDQIGRFTVVKTVGSGAFGVVYQAHDNTLSRDVAIKLITRLQSTREVESWLDEAKVLAKLDHAAIVPVYDVGRTPSGHPYIVSKYIEGGTLLDLLRKSTMTVQNAVQMVRELGRALGYLHGQGVMHRDIKPSNILIDSEGRPVLADFGLALQESEFGRGARFVGTPAYMSPEQARFEGHRVDGRSDIYSLGVVLYEMLTGTRPFKAHSQEELLDCIRSVEVRPPRQINSNIPRDLERVCLRALAKKVTDRYASADDFVADLEATLQDSLVHVSVAAETTDLQQITSDSPSKESLGLNNVAVIPRGLRPFEPDDADFFSFLLPGAKDRLGVPDSVSFWSKRILARDPDDTFRVGVLLGPSGSGKSSLMRAGVLPRVRENVRVIYVQSKPNQLEETLLRRIGHVVDEALTPTSLVQALTVYRQRGSHQPDQPKLLLVIDQFEQWLNLHRDGSVTELHEALRQCDGTHVQAILLARDDFLLGLTAFMDELDEVLLQNQNFATVEPFNALHAESVLAAFGRAYRTIDDPCTPEQELFLSEAIEELKRLNAVSPLQVSILADTIKDRPWNLQTLKAIGGVHGFGIAFLDDRLLGSSAHPLLRAELTAVKEILRELLPIDNSTIKAAAVPQHVLLERLAAHSSEETLHKLLQLLDTEVRLITPAGGDSHEQGSASSAREPSYQLTHDFLVPTTRQWLAMQETSTRAGRARLLLRDMASTWNASPSARHLPSLVELASFRWLTSPKTWTATERRFIQTAERRLSMQVFVWTAALIALVASAGLWLRRSKIESLANRLVEVDDRALAELLSESRPYRSHVREQVLERAVDDSANTDRIRFHVDLLMAGESGDDAEAWIPKLHTIAPEHLATVIDYLATIPLDQQVLSQQIGELAQEENVPALLPAVALSARLSPQDQTLQSHAPAIARALISVPEGELRHWIPQVLPLGTSLLPPLTAFGSNREFDNGNQKRNCALLIDALARDGAAADALVKGLQWCPDEMFASMVNGFPDVDELKLALRKDLLVAQTLNEYPPVSPNDSDFARTLANAEGAVYDHCAWAQKIRVEDLDRVIAMATESGYAATSVRPYLESAPATLRATVIWERDSRSSTQLQLELSEAEIVDSFEARQQEGWKLQDFGTYMVPLSSDQRWYALWSRTENSTANQILRMNENLSSIGQFERSLAKEKQNVICVRSVEVLGPSGDLLINRLYEPVPTGFSVVASRLRYGFGDLYPGYKITDIRSQNTLAGNDRGTVWYRYHRAEIEQSSKSARDKVNQARRLNDAGEYRRAIDLLEDVTQERIDELPSSLRASTNRGRLRFLARAYAGVGDISALENVIETVKTTEGMDQRERVYFTIRKLILQQSVEKVKPNLDYLAGQADASKLRNADYLDALASVAAAGFDEYSDACFQQLVQRIKDCHQSGDYPQLTATVVRAVYDPLRERAEWRSLLQMLGAESRFSMCGHHVENQDTKFTFGETLAIAKQSSQQLAEAGFRPTAWHIYEDATGTLRTATAWARKKLPEGQLAKTAAEQARLSAALNLLGESDSFSSLLKGSWGRSSQSYLTTKAADLLPAELIVATMGRATTSEELHSAISALGGYTPQQLSTDQLQVVTLRLQELAKDSRASVAQCAQWCLEHWSLLENSPQALASATTNVGPRDQESADWYINGLGMSFIKLQPPELVLTGRVEKPAERRWIRLNRRFAMATTETDMEIFELFLQDPRMQTWMERAPQERLPEFDGPNGHPATHVSWQHAVRFAQWLNEQEDVPSSEWCYLDVWGESPRYAENYLDRSGYRLPTEVEWEWSCAAGSEAAWHFGSDRSLGQYFEWFSPHSEETLGKLRQLRPNRFGLFGMGANAVEWCDDLYDAPFRPENDFAITDAGNVRFPSASDLVIRRGGQYNFSIQSARTNNRTVNASSYLRPTSGFRLARTLKDR